MPVLVNTLEASTGGGVTDMNLEEVGGVAVATGAGVVTAGTLRVAFANDSPLPTGTNKIGGVEIRTSGGVTAAEILDSGTDGLSNAFNEFITAGMNYVFNGVSWDRAVGGAGNASSATARVVQAGTSTGTASNVASSAASVTLLAANASRRGATIFNDSTQTLYLKLGATASTTSFAAKLVTDAYYEVPFNYSGIIDGIWASANGFARVTELT